jgi:hypothetical protein
MYDLKHPTRLPRLIRLIRKWKISLYAVQYIDDQTTGRWRINQNQIHTNPDQKADPSTIKGIHDDHFLAGLSSVCQLSRYVVSSLVLVTTYLWMKFGEVTLFYWFYGFDNDMGCIGFVAIIPFMSPFSPIDWHRPNK